MANRMPTKRPSEASPLRLPLGGNRVALPAIAGVVLATLLALVSLWLGPEAASSQSAPAVTGVAVSSSATRADNTYALGETIRVTLTFSEAVDVSGMPRLKIDMDPADWGEKWANYESGSGTASLAFAHEVVEPNISTQGIAVLANTLELNGGDIDSAATEADADLAHMGLGHDANHKVDWRLSPVLAPSSVSYDTDSDGLIEIANAAQLNAIRWDTDGDGTPASGNATDYATAFNNAAPGMGCPSTGCTGYEIGTGAAMEAAVTIDLDTSPYNTDPGWVPVADFTATLEGNGHTVSALFVNRTGDKTGLLASIGSGGRVRNLKLVSVNVTGGNSTGVLAGENNGHVSAVSAAGSVNSSGTTIARVGGLVGHNTSTGKVLGSYAEVAVTGGADTSNVGGLVGRNEGEVTAAWADGTVKGHSQVGGLVGENHSDATVTASYSRGLPSGIGATPADIGGLVGKNAGTVTNSYYDQYTSNQSDTGKGEPRSTDELASPTSYTGIYANWNVDLDNADTDNDPATGGDSPWAFGGAADYPVLVYGSLAAADQSQPTRVLSAATNRYGTGVRITFSRDLQAAAFSEAGFEDAFSVSAGGADVSVSSGGKDPDNGSVLWLRLASKIIGGQAVTTSYSRPNAEDRRLKDSDGRAIAAYFNLPVTNTLPSVTGLSITSTPALPMSTYGAGEHIDVTVEFNVPVRVARLPQLEIVVGSNNRQAAYSSGSGTDSLVFRYTVTTDDADSDGISITANTLTLNDGTITDKYGEAGIDTVYASLGHDEVAPQSGHKVDGSKTQDSHAPTLSGAAVYHNGLTLSYSEPLDTGSVPGKDDFEVNVTEDINGQDTVKKVAVNSVAVGRSEVTLTLVSNVSPVGYFKKIDPIRVTYTKGDNPVRDIAGNDAAAFTDFAVNLVPIPDVGHADDFVSARDPLRPSDNPIIYRPVFVSWQWQDRTGILPAVTQYVVSYKPTGEGTERFTWPVDAGIACDASGNCTCHIRTTPTAEETPPVPEQTCHVKLFGSVPVGGSGKFYVVYALDAKGNNIAQSGYLEHTVPDNNKPEFSDPATTRTVPENSSAGVSVGAPFTATDDDKSDTLTYRLGGDDAAGFDIDSSLGQISVGSGTTLDYEADKNSYSVLVTVSDTKEETNIAVTIDVTDEDEPPDAPTDLTVVSPFSYDRLSLTWTAPPNSGKPPVTNHDLRYFKGAADPPDDPDWTSGPDVGSDTTATISRLDASSDYRVQVRARNDEGSGPWSASAVGTTQAEPTPAPTTAPTPAPTTAPTPAPTTAPTPAPTTAPTPAPTTAPTPAPTPALTPAPTPALTPAPTTAPTPAPTPTPIPIRTVTSDPGPTQEPTAIPTAVPTATAVPIPTATFEPKSAPEPTTVPEPIPILTLTPEPTVTPTPTPGPTATPTPRPAPTATPASTTTPASTATPAPTATPVPTATPAPTPARLEQLNVPIVADAEPRVRGLLNRAIAAGRDRLTLVIILGVALVGSLSVFVYLMLRRR